MIDKSQYIFGTRAVMEAFEAGKQIDKILVKKDLKGDLVHSLLTEARQRAVPVQKVPIERLNRITRGNHQGVIALLAAVNYYKVDDVVPMLFDEGKIIEQGSHDKLMSNKDLYSELWNAQAQYYA